MASRVPSWMIVMFVIQAGLAGLLFLVGYDFTVASNRGGPPSTDDMLFLATPMAVVAAAGAAAWWQFRVGRPRLAAALVFAPISLIGLLLVWLIVGYLLTELGIRGA